jgi:hypothetical protein
MWIENSPHFPTVWSTNSTVSHPFIIYLINCTSCCSASSGNDSSGGIVTMLRPEEWRYLGSRSGKARYLFFCDPRGHLPARKKRRMYTPDGKETDGWSWALGAIQVREAEWMELHLHSSICSYGVLIDKSLYINLNSHLYKKYIYIYVRHNNNSL